MTDKEGRAREIIRNLTVVQYLMTIDGKEVQEAVDIISKALIEARKEAFEEAAEIIENGCFCSSKNKSCELTEAAADIRREGEKEKK